MTISRMRSRRDHIYHVIVAAVWQSRDLAEVSSMREQPPTEVGGVRRVPVVAGCRCHFDPGYNVGVE